MLRKTMLAISAGFALSVLAGAAAATEIDLSSLANADITTYFDGSAYPQHGGPITIGGVGFNLIALNDGGTGALQTGGATNTFSINVNEAGVTSVYSIVNSAFGESGKDVGSLTFTGSGGATYTYDFIEGQNVRDHATTSYNTSAPDVYATANFSGGDRLDVQKILLPSAFASQTLTTITFASGKDTGNPNGEPFLAALTTSNASGAPEPAAWALMIIGFGGLGATLRRRRTALSQAAA